MTGTEENSVLQELRRMPGVGAAIAKDLYDMGFRSIQDLKDRDPEEIYRRHCGLKGMPIDRCVLYVFRCAVYYASSETHDPAMLKWWNWKDK